MHYNYGKVDLDGPLTALQASYTLTVVAARRGWTDGSSHKQTWDNIGALIIRIGFGVYCTIIIIRNPKTL